MSPNDIRELENRNPIEGGDSYYSPMNLAPVDSVNDGSVRNKGASSKPIERKDPDAMVETIKIAHSRIIADIVSRLVNKECKAAKNAAKKFAGNKEGFDKWSYKFYNEQQSQLVDSLTATAGAMLYLTGDKTIALDYKAIQNWLENYAMAYTEDHFRFLNHAFDNDNVVSACDEWAKFVPSDIANDLTNHFVSTKEDEND